MTSQTKTRVRRSASEKREIVAEAIKSGEPIPTIAKKHHVNPALIYRWKKQFRVRPEKVDIKLPEIIETASTEIELLKSRVVFLEKALHLANEQIALYRGLITERLGMAI